MSDDAKLLGQRGGTIGMRRRSQSLVRFGMSLAVLGPIYCAANAPALDIAHSVLARVFDAETGRFRPAYRIYQAAEPHEFENGAVVETRLSIPSGSRIDVTADGRLLLPDGALVTKQFSYLLSQERPRNSRGRESCEGRMVVRTDAQTASHSAGSDICLVELRILEKADSAWVPHVYVWSDHGWTPAPGGRIVLMKLSGPDSGSARRFDYLVPGLGECRACHDGTRDAARFGPIGLSAARLDKASFNRLAGPGAERDRARRGGSGLGDDARGSRARAYLHANCGYCHNPNGLAASSGLMLDEGEGDALHRGICKRPVAFGAGFAFGAYDIEPSHPERSILIYRMASLVPGIAMPELGRSLLDSQGMAIVADWIANMEGQCDDAQKLQ